MAKTEMETTTPDINSILQQREQAIAFYENQITEATKALAALRGTPANAPVRRRGRKAGTAKKAKKAGKRRALSPETRAKMAAAAKKRWAAKKKAEK